MKSYQYKATDKNGVTIDGTFKANSRDQVADYLRGRELFIVTIQEDIQLSLEKLNEISIGGVSLKDKMLLMKQFYLMLTAGLPILQTLDILAKQMDNKSLQEQLDAVKTDVEGGAALSASFQKNSDIFSEIQLNLLAAGEKSGNLVEIVKQITADMESSNELLTKIRGAMIYPAIIFVAIIGVVAVLIVYMVPTVKSLYQDFNAEDKIPDITKLLISFSEFLNNPVGIIISLVIIGIAVAGFISFKNTPAGKAALARVVLRMPVFGDLIMKIQLAEFGRLLSMLLRSGVSILDSLKIVSTAMPNLVYQEAVLGTIDEVSKGVSLSIPLAKSGVFPLVYVRMIATGEQTGNLDKVLNDMGAFYAAEVKDITDNLSKLMEPLILLVVGGVVAFLAVAVYLPIYNIGNAIT